MRNFFHRLFNPHCDSCEHCKSCEVLKEEVFFLRAENKMLMERLFPEPVTAHATREDKEWKPVGKGYVPWAVTRQKLEAEDARASMVAKREFDDTIEKLEKEVGLGNATEQAL